MKKVLLLAVLAGGLAFGQTKNLVSSEVHWWGYKIAKTEASSHTGTVNVKSGNLILKNKAVVGGSFVLDMNSLTSTDQTGEYLQKLNNHLKTADFFDVEKYPTATYTITSVKKNSNKDYNFVVNGNLTVKGKTNPVSFPAKITSNNGVITLESDKFSFDRQKFDVAYKSTMQDILVKDVVDMTVKVTVK